MSGIILARPQPGEYAPFYERYIARVPDGDLVAHLDRQLHATAELLGGLSEAQGEHRYEPGKWSVKEVVLHVSDSERVFAYRALRFARGDATPLPGFDQDPWVPAAEVGRRTLRDVADEFRAVRLATVALARSLTEEQGRRTGIANDTAVSVRAVLFMLAGHELHHLAVLRERYAIG